MRGFLYEDIFLKIIDLGAELPEHSLTQRGGGGGGGEEEGERGVRCVPWAVNSGGMMFRVDSHSVEDELVGGSSS